MNCKYVVLTAISILLCCAKGIYSADNSYCGIYDKNNTGRRWIDKISKLYGPVIYKVYTHENIPCNSCHHANKSNEYNCEACHKEGELQEAYHRTCQGCHKHTKKGPTECLGCHEQMKPIEKAYFNTRIDRFEPTTIVINRIKRNKGHVVFSHKDHSRLVKNCRECHHKDEPGYEKSCSQCHFDKADGKKIELKEAFHKTCKGCHQRERRGPTKCDECHHRK
jgi:hypothetical protein